MLTLTNAAPGLMGPYSVIVSNRCGAVTSETAVVSVNDCSIGTSAAYVNVQCAPGYSLFAVPIGPTSPANQKLGNVLTYAPDGATVFKLDGNGWLANSFLNGWSDPEMVLNVGEGWYIHNPQASTFFITFTGKVLYGDLTNRLPTGFSVCASIAPHAGLLLSQLAFPPTPGVQVFLFDSANENYRCYQEDEWGEWPAEPSLAIAQAFWVKEPQAQEWIRTFTRNPPWGIDSTGGNNGYMVIQPEITSTTAEINFFTYHTNSALGRVLDLDGITPVTDKFCGQIYACTNGLESALVPVGVPAPFLSGAGAGYIRAGTVQIPGVRGGERVYVQLRVWEPEAGETYEVAVRNGCAAGRSTIFSVTGHAPIENDGPGLPPRNANMFPSFSVSHDVSLPLRVARLRPTGSDLTLSVCTMTNFIYYVQRAPTCTEQLEWSDVEGTTVWGTGYVVKISIPFTLATEGYYRVQRWSPEFLDSHSNRQGVNP